MRVIIAGSRHLTNPILVSEAVEQYETIWAADYGPITEVVSGACPTGIDALGEAWARSQGLPIRKFPAAWGKHGRAAGPIRNEEMALYAQGCIVIHTGTPGSLDMLRRATQHGLVVHEVRCGSGKAI